MGRHRSTIFRELRRNPFHDSERTYLSGYWGVSAQSFSDNRRRKQRKLIKHGQLLVDIVAKLKIGWTPEQIAGQFSGRMRPPPRFSPDLSILFRPDVVAHRKEFRHWQANLVLFRQKYGPANITTMVERVGRFTLALKNEQKRTKPVIAQIIRAFEPLPAKARRSVTFDRGSGFVDWPHLEAETGAKAWFCEAQSPWQKAHIENTNRRLRRWLDRGH